MKSIENMEVVEEAPKPRSQMTSFGVVVDALPYIDQGYDEPGVREAVSFLLNDQRFSTPY
jgi:hypothetical protein